MMYYEELWFLSKLYFNKIYGLKIYSFILYFYGVWYFYTIFTKTCRRYTKLKSLTSKIQWTAGSIGFVQNSLHHKVVQTFSELKGQFMNRNEKVRAEQAILKVIY